MSNKNKNKIPVSRHNFAFDIRNYVNYTRLVILVTTVLFTVGGAYYAFFYTPKYRSTIMLSAKVFNSLGAAASSQEKRVQVEDKDTAAPRELELIQSDEVLAEVVCRLHLDVLVNGEVYNCNSSPIRISELNIPRALEDKKISLVRQQDERYDLYISGLSIELTGKLNEPLRYQLEEGDFLLTLSEWSDTGRDKVVLKKKSVYEAINDLHGVTMFEAPGIDQNLVTNLIVVSAVSMDPAMAALIANTISEVAVEKSKDDERSEAEASAMLLKVERMQLENVLNSHEIALSQLHLDLGQPTTNSEVNAELASRRIQNLDAEIALADSELKKLSQTMTFHHPKYRQTAARLASYQHAKKELIHETHKTISREQDYLNVERKLQVFGHLYDEISRELQIFEARLQEPVGNLRVLRKAMAPDYPYSYSRSVIILLSSLVGMICGYIAALVFR